jgi:hypothetical protein
MQQLNRNTLDLPWDGMGLEPGDIVSFTSGILHKVVSVAPEGITAVRCGSDREIIGPQKRRSPDWLNGRRIRIVKKCSS